MQSQKTGTMSEYVSYSLWAILIQKTSFQPREQKACRPLTAGCYARDGTKSMVGKPAPELGLEQACISRHVLLGDDCPKDIAL